jgi:hypothetical protein
MTTSERAGNLFDYASGPKVKGKLESLIKQYSQDRENPTSLLNLKDEFNGLSFHLGEIVCKAKDILNTSSIEATNTFNRNYLKAREVISEDGKKTTVESAKYRARLETSESYLIESQADISYTMIREYKDVCRSYRDSIIQRIAVLRDDIFSSRQQV